MYWFDKKGKDTDVFLSSRVRIARNFKDYPFEPMLCETASKEIIEKVRGALSDGGYSEEPVAPDLAEKRIISRELAHKKTPRALFVNEKEDTYVMVCEEDHLRLQCVKAGFDLRGALEGAIRCDEKIDVKCTVAFDEKLGYLTHCPTNLGTGMRASVMMHLPALAMTGKLKGIENQLVKLGFTVRGCEGEGSEALGDLYQISNSASLGLTEEEVIEKLESCAVSVAQAERDMRQRLMNEKEDALRDKILRSLGTAKYAHMLTTKEMYSLYSDIRLGISLGIIEKDAAELDRLLMSCLPYSLSEGKELSPTQRDRKRAEKFSKV